jgi:hypothetical protein
MADTAETLHVSDAPKTIPAFYESIPPRIVPQLHSQTEILLHNHHVPTLMAHEERTVRSSGPIRSRQRSRFLRSEPYAKAVTFMRSRRSPTPLVRSTVKTGVASKSRSASPENSEHSDFEASLSYDSDDSVLSQVSASDSTRIPKPMGEVGRPNSGGYNLRDELELHPKSFTALKVLDFLFLSYLPLP